jgi:hypothetical protein
MADQPETTDETTPATDDKDDLVRPAGMNPHTEPGQTSGESASGE